MLDTIPLLRAALAVLIGALTPGGETNDAPDSPAPEVRAVAEGDRTVGVGSHLLDRRSIDRLHDLGVRHVRTTLYWSHWSDREYRRTFSRNLRSALEAGLEPLIVVHHQPTGGYPDRQRVYRDFARFMAERVAEFPEVRYWQLWNEMDAGFTDVFGAGHSDVSLRERGRNYAAMLELAYPAIKAANPNAVVVTGGIATGIRDGFLQGMYDAGARFDVLAIHTYGFPIGAAFRNRGLEARTIMRRHRDDRPLWNTEFGMESAVVAPGWPASARDIDGYHLDTWKGSIEGNHREGIYDRIYGHVLEQGGDLSYDLVRSDGSPRPAYLWLKEWMQGR